MKTVVSKDVVLAYPVYSQGFEIYTDSSKFQPEAIITCKLNTVQQKYSMTEQELLVIVDILKEHKDMPWGQTITVYVDHKNLLQDALGF
ncbi:hypothetical protein ACHAW6_000288 [Cyclotella cf. meneghiniana]